MKKFALLQRIVVLEAEVRALKTESRTRAPQYPARTWTAIDPPGVTCPWCGAPTDGYDHPCAHWGTGWVSPEVGYTAPQMR